MNLTRPIGKSLLCLLCLLTLGASLGQAAAVKNDAIKEPFRKLGIIRAAGLVPGAQTPLYDLSGNLRKIEDFRGKTVLLNLWATWCPDCIAEMPSLERLQQKLGTEDFAVVAVDLRESRDQVARFAQKHNLSFTILLDEEGQMGWALGVRAIPTSILIGADGAMLGKVLGPREWDSKDYVALLQRLMEK